MVAEPVPPESPSDSPEPTPEFRYPVHTYQCRNCKTSRAVGLKATPTTPYLCPLCRSRMRYLWTYWRREAVK